MAGYRIKNTLDSDVEFEATYKGYQVHICRQGFGEMYPDPNHDPMSGAEFTPRDGEAYYIRVGEIGTTIGSLYEGYWEQSYYTIEEAVEEALIGSNLIEQSQRKLWRATP